MISSPIFSQSESFELRKISEKKFRKQFSSRSFFVSCFFLFNLLLFFTFILFPVPVSSFCRLYYRAQSLWLICCQIAWPLSHELMGAISSVCSGRVKSLLHSIKHSSLKFSHQLYIFVCRNLLIQFSTLRRFHSAVPNLKPTEQWCCDVTRGRSLAKYLYKVSICRGI